MDYTEACRYRKKIIIYLDRSRETLVWLTPLIRHDDPKIAYKLAKWEQKLISVAKTMEGAKIYAIGVQVEKVPYEN